jgi:hypothetical protein
MEMREGCAGKYKLRDHVVAVQKQWATPRSGKTTDENPETWALRQAKGDVATMPLTAQVKAWATLKADSQSSERRITSGAHNGRRRIAEAGGPDADTDRQTQPPLGGDSDGSTDWLDYAELQVSCDNRTDELRLLGNGVVPATAERAFRVLIEEINK